MAFRPRAWLRRKAHERVRAEWAAMPARAGAMGQARLADLSEQARGLRHDLDQFLLAADRRGAQSRAALSALPLPGGTDWRWRPGFLSGRIAPTGMASPENGAALGDSARVWHDCAEHALMLRQVQNMRATDLAGYGLQMEVMGFSGSFLSVSVDLPAEALIGLTKNHIVRLESAIEIESEMDIYARLNIGNGPNTDELLRHLGGMRAGQVNHHVTEFDLAYTEINENRLEKIWLDLIFEGPVMNAVQLRELVFSRHPRSNM
ncbi:MAG: DUF6478 family protein [Paracoccus sp. (in: a-proteobacteria)]|nr:DUF6478 family protein [Paracoccus sp. (in: a-proteobacteria)]